MELSIWLGFLWIQMSFFAVTYLLLRIMVRLDGIWTNTDQLLEYAKAMSENKGGVSRLEHEED